MHLFLIMIVGGPKSVHLLIGCPFYLKKQNKTRDGASVHVLENDPPLVSMHLFAFYVGTTKEANAAETVPVGECVVVDGRLTIGATSTELYPVGEHAAKVKNATKRNKRNPSVANTFRCVSLAGARRRLLRQRPARAAARVAAARLPARRTLAARRQSGPPLLHRHPGDLTLERCGTGRGQEPTGGPAVGSDAAAARVRAAAPRHDGPVADGGADGRRRPRRLPRLAAGARRPHRRRPRRRRGRQGAHPSHLHPQGAPSGLT